MISEYLLSLARCPVCIEGSSRATSPEMESLCREAVEALAGLERPDHALCLAHYPAVWKCPDGIVSKRKLTLEDGGARCACCGSLYPFSKENGFLDMRPPEGTFSDLTQYADEEFHHRPGPLRPLFLSARIKTDMMARMLRLSTKDRVVDVGCGNGRVVFFKRASCAQLVGIDAGEHFAAEAAATVDLTRGDIRRLPFATASFDKAYSLDVMEHLPEDGVRAMLAETRRILRPGGLFFAYSHVMMSSRLAGFQRAVNRLVAWLDRRGLVDNKPERDRKSDHVNALKSYEQLESLLAESGFRIERIRYYNVVMKAVIEDLFLPLVEHNLWRRRQKAKGPLSKNTSEADETSAERPNVGRWAHAPLALATALLRLDVALFGRVRTGPFFLLLRAL